MKKVKILLFIGVMFFLPGCSSIGVVWEEKNGVNLPHLNSDSWHLKVKLNKIEIEYRIKI